MTTTAFPSDDPFAFASTWGLGDDAYSFILADLLARDSRSVVEFGSGTSTLRLARDLPNATVVSIESDAHFHDELRERLAVHDPAGRVQLRAMQLRWQVHAGSLYLSYAASRFPDKIDSVLVDGPPQWTRRGREACLYQVFSALRVGGRIYLDDCRRPEEQRILANWQRSFAGSVKLVRVEPVGHHVAVLEKTADGRAHWRPSVALDVGLAAARIGIAALRRRVKPAAA